MDREQHGAEVDPIETKAPDAAAAEPDKIPWPPQRDARLYDFFNGDGLCLGGQTYERSGGFAAPDPERRLIHSGHVGFARRTETELYDRMPTVLAAARAAGLEPDALKQERTTNAARYNATAAILARLPAETVRILRLGFGPQDAVPSLKLGWNAPVGEDAKQSKRYALLDKLGDKFGDYRQVIPETTVAREAYAKWLQERNAKAAEAARERAVARRAKAKEAAEREKSAITAARREVRSLQFEHSCFLSATSEHKQLTGVVSADDRRLLQRSEQKIEDAKARLAAEKKRVETTLTIDTEAVAPIATSFEDWLVEIATQKQHKQLLEEIKTAARQLVRHAHHAWATLRGRRAPRTPPGFAFDRSEYE